MVKHYFILDIKLLSQTDVTVGLLRIQQPKCLSSYNFVQNTVNICRGTKCSTEDSKYFGCDVDSCGMFCQACGKLHCYQKNGGGFVTDNVRQEYLN